MIIAFSGRKNSGKTTLAKILTEDGFTKLSFATELKSLVSKLYDIPLQHLSDQQRKEEILSVPFFWNKDMARKLANMIGAPDVLKSDEKEFYKIREALQFIGTDVLRAYDNEFHVKTLAKYIDKDKNYVLDDVRFKNELAALKSLGAICLYIIRPYYFEEYSNHRSEIDLNRGDFDYVLLNDRDKDFFVKKFNEFKQIFSRKFIKSKIDRTDLINKMKLFNGDTNKIADLYECTRNNIVWMCRRMCIPIRRNKYVIDDDAFLTANKQSAYWAGFISADGCVKTPAKNKNHRVLELVCDDKSAVYGFRKFLKSNKKVYERKRASNKTGYYFTVNSPYIIDDMKLWNIEPRKSKHNKIPDCITKNDDLIRCWLIGLIDGDGSIFISNGYLVISVLASREIIDYIVSKFSWIQGSVSQEKKIDNLFSVRFTGSNAVRFFNSVHIDNLGLERKWGKRYLCDDNGKLLCP